MARRQPLIPPLGRSLWRHESSGAAISTLMRANVSRDTRPELRLRSLLHHRGYRFRKDLALDLPGARVRPDIVFLARRVAVFVDGCFWHGCPQHGRVPKVHNDYWATKLGRNVQRDRAADEHLRAAGWTVVRVWEHLTPEEGVEQVIAVLGNARGAGHRPRATPISGS